MAIRGVSIPSVDMNVQLRQKVKKLWKYIGEAFTDQNNIDEDTRMQIELVDQALAELQVKYKL
ncbi:MAG: hypothetical protein ACLU30_20890 [Odoribacter splanchnicus]